MKQKKNKDPQLDTLKFIAIAVVLMLLADQYIFGGKRSYIENAKQQSVAERMINAEIQDLPAPVLVTPEDGAEYFEHPEAPEDNEPAEEVLPKSSDPKDQATTAPDVSAAQPDPAPEVVHPAYQGTPRIAIVIDDLGMDVKRSRKIIDMKEPITLAFLPYAPKTKELASLGKSKGHSLIIHTPMEATNRDLNIGPIGLRTSMGADEFNKNFGQILASFEGYEGINNHMGSLLTQDAQAMTRLMQMLKERNLFFVDSRTINKSVAAQKAKEAGVPYAVRDVFLDHVDSIEFVRSALRQTEAIAKRRGHAIAIGHPRDVTIQGLQEWLPTLKAKGIEIVPVKDLLVRPVGIAEPLSVAKEPQPVILNNDEAVEVRGNPAPAENAGPVENNALELNNAAGSSFSVTLPDGTEQQIHLPPAQLPSLY
jgi:polysaccharide deacetylase 2 family uncharacterized protein YibQ